MKAAAAFTILICCAVSALSLDGDAKKFKPSATVTPAQEFNPTPGAATTKPTSTMVAMNTTVVSNTTTVAPKTTTAAHNKTTTAPKTTTAAPKTTTAAHNKTTTAPKTTTAAPKTTTAAHNKTTTAPKTTTTAPKTAAPSPPGPTPPTSLTVGHYTLKKDNKICLIAQMSLQIRLEKANTTFKVQPNYTTVGGGCEKTTANLTLYFKEGFITFMFNKSTANDAVYVNQLSFNISYFFNSAKGQHIANNGSVHLFPAKIGYSYSCRNLSLYMGSGLHLDVGQDRMQAFNLTNDKDFGPPDSCPADKSDYSVAIGVAVALLVLIVIVVVVYIVSRKKRSDGYQSL